MSQPKETRCVVLEGDLVRVQRTVTEREVKTSDFIGEIARLQPLDTGPLPPACVWYMRREDDRNRALSVYVLERGAGLQEVRYKAEREADAGVEMLRLSWPRTLWFVRCVGEAVQDVHLTATAGPACEKGRDTELYTLPMPNLYDNGHGAVCLGNLVVKDGLSLPARIESLVQQVLESLWNSDLEPQFEETGVADLEDWAKKSSEDPQFYQRLKLAPHRQGTVGGLLTFLLEKAP